MFQFSIFYFLQFETLFSQRPTLYNKFWTTYHSPQEAINVRIAVRLRNNYYYYYYCFNKGMLLAKNEYCIKFV